MVYRCSLGAFALAMFMFGALISGAQAADGAFHFHVRLYAADTDSATDVRGIAVLTGPDLRPMRKKLLADFDRLRPDGVDNLEGLSWGRPLANGHSTLVLVSDDNFSARQTTQVWLFEVLPDPPTPNPTHP